MKKLVIPTMVYYAIRDGEWGLFFGNNGEQCSVWLKNKTHGITNTSNFAFGETHQDALSELNLKLMHNS